MICNRLKSLIVVAAIVVAAGFRASPVTRNLKSSLSMSFVDDIVAVKGKVFSRLSNFKGPIGFYALMLAPIYGIGFLGLPFLGSMTDFSTLQNRGSPGVIANEYIVAPRGFTPARASEAPVFDVSAADLEKAFDTVVLRQPRISQIATDESTHRREYVQRALLFRWPDVITVQVIPFGETKSSLAVHSYSIYGAGDLGVNAARVNSWLTELEIDLEKK